jgi:F-type H+-transporting ATPase subunit gamma
VTAELQALAAHLRAIQQTIPLLETIRSVAEIAYRRTARSVGPIQDYAAKVDALLDGITAAMDADERIRFIDSIEESGPEALLVVSSERGLCGAFHSVLAAKVLQLVRERSASGNDTRVVCWGGKAQRLIEAQGQAVLYGRSLPSVVLPSYEEVEAMALEILALREQYRFGRILVVHNAHAGRFRYEIRLRQLLPPQLERTPRRQPLVDLKPAGDARGLAAHALAEWVITGLYGAVVESALSEQLARIATMRLAVENARKLLRTLEFEYNLAHQQQVTNSLLEVISGYRSTTGT